MSQDQNAKDPLEFVRGMWNNMGFSLPGMVTPTLDLEELDKRIADLKAVEGWLKMNLNMLQMSTQGLEMQRAAVAAVKAMSQHTEDKPAAGADPGANPFAAAAAMWPWNFMDTQGEQPASPPAEAKPRADSAGASGSASRRKPAGTK